MERRILDMRGSFAQVHSASDLYGVPAAQQAIPYIPLIADYGDIDILLIQDGVHCSPQILRVSEVASLAEDAQRPQIYISGEIHGDERVVEKHASNQSRLNRCAGAA